MVPLINERDVAKTRPLCSPAHPYGSQLLLERRSDVYTFFYSFLPVRKQKGGEGLGGGTDPPDAGESGECKFKL